MSISEPIPVAVIGCGRMGQLHARVYSQMDSVRLVGVHDADDDVAAMTVEKYGGEVFKKIEDLAERIAAATIAVPTQFHAFVAEPLLRRGVACLIEKPLAKDVEDAKQIVAWAKQHNAVVQVGHIERFNPAIRSMTRLGISPRFIEVVRISPLTFRSIDVGVVLDMMIHDIDIVLNLARSKVTRIDAIGVGVIGGVEDVCNAAWASPTVRAPTSPPRASASRPSESSGCSRRGYVSIDYQKKYGIVARKTEN
jgi:predicted dehydrogenase